MQTLTDIKKAVILNTLVEIQAKAQALTLEIHIATPEIVDRLAREIRNEAHYLSWTAFRSDQKPDLIGAGITEV